MSVCHVYVHTTIVWNYKKIHNFKNILWYNPLSIWALHYDALLMMITNQLMKRMDWFCEIWVPFELEYWMLWHTTWIELRLDKESIELN